jgi:hypothetical protein
MMNQKNIEEPRGKLRGMRSLSRFNPEALTCFFIFQGKP